MIIIDKDLSAREVAAGFASVFAVPIADVAVVDDLILKPDFHLEPNVQILVDRQRAQGQFVATLNVILHTPGPEKTVHQLGDLELVRRLSNAWQCQCLVSDDALDPYQWVLVQPTGDKRVVHLEADRLDDGDEFVIRSYGRRLSAGTRLRLRKVS